MKLVCANCGIEIRWQPTIVDGKPYCCWGCSQGGPCNCDYSNLPLATDKVALACHIVIKESLALLQHYNQQGRKP
jgi:hypothetical protein